MMMLQLGVEAVSSHVPALCTELDQAKPRFVICNFIYNKPATWIKNGIRGYKINHLCCKASTEGAHISYPTLSEKKTQP